MTDMGFKDVVLYCAKQPRFLAEFNRLTGCELGKSARRSPIEVMIDEATNNPAESEEDMQMFIAFVYTCVWCTLPDEAFTEVT